VIDIMSALKKSLMQIKKPAASEVKPSGARGGAKKKRVANR
jgi:hypothetical protein